MFGMTITGPLFPLYFVRVADMADSWIAAITTAASAVIIFSYFIWTRQVHKRSSRFPQPLPAQVPADASAFYARNLSNLLEIMVDKSDTGPVLRDLDQDEITQAMRVGV